jgi:hypothetical protein
VFDLQGAGTTPTYTISTGGLHRADELCIDPKHDVVLVANNAEAPFPFATLISTKTHTALTRIPLDGNNGTPKATNGAEQCQYDPRTDRFYISVPEINGPGDNSAAGGVAVIDHAGKVETTFVIPLAQCSGPQGMAIGPDHQILLGCNGAVNANASTVVIDDRDGHVLATLNNESGADEVWYNPDDGHYFLARSSAVGTSQFLGVVDVERRKTQVSSPPAKAPASAMPARLPPIGSATGSIFRSQAARPGAFARRPVATARMAASPYSPPRGCEAEGSPLTLVSEDGDGEFHRRRCD